MNEKGSIYPLYTVLLYLYLQYSRLLDLCSLCRRLREGGWGSKIISSLVQYEDYYWSTEHGEYCLISLTRICYTNLDHEYIRCMYLVAGFGNFMNQYINLEVFVLENIQVRNYKPPPVSIKIKYRYCRVRNIIFTF